MPYASLPKPDSPEPAAAVRAIMKGNRHADTVPELALRSALHTLGLRFRKDYRIAAGVPRGVRADIVFTHRRVAVFVDGCFWHGCPEHGHTPRTNGAYWSEKLRLNSARDARNSAVLKAEGWVVVRVWEHEPLDVAVAVVLEALARRA